MVIGLKSRRVRRAACSRTSAGFRRATASGLLLALGGCLTPALAQDALDRLNAATVEERAVAQAQTQTSAAGWVHCLFPGQVRRLGMSTTMTPRRAARVLPSECQAGGGEYAEPADTLGAIKVWLPLAGEGVPDAQATLGELYERQGQAQLARVWYEKAAAQGVARAQLQLAHLDLQASGTGTGAGTGTTSASSARAFELVTAAAGGALVAGLVLRSQEAPRIDLLEPEQALVLPRPSRGHYTLSLPEGPSTVLARITAPSGLGSIQVNGQIRQADAQGLLSLPVTLPATLPTSPSGAVAPADDALDIEVTDQQGLTVKARLKLQRSGLPLAASGGLQPRHVPSEPLALSPGRRHALVIANQAYRHWARLDTAVADGEAIGAVLQQRFGFQVTLVRDASRQQMLKALQTLRQAAGPNDQVLIYYAGHGQMDPVTARGYWIPVDGDEKDLSQWVSVIDVSDQLSAMSSRHVMVVADSCYGGTLMRSLLPQVDEALSAGQRRAPLRFLAERRARVAMTSGGLEPVVDGGSVGHSLFARSLLDVLGQVQGPVAAQELFGAVSSRFAHLGRRLKLQQQPHYAPISFAGHEAGDFVIAPM